MKMIRKSSPLLTKDLGRRIWNHKWLYVLLAPAILYYVIFKYWPMYGVVIAFKDYNVFKGISESEWAGLEVFSRIFRNVNFWNAVRNTLLLNLVTLSVTFPITIVVSLMLNEVLSVRFKKVSQSLLYLPHFISWVVVAGIATNLFSQRNGTINNLIMNAGGEAVPFLSLSLIHI